LFSSLSPAIDPHRIRQPETRSQSCTILRRDCNHIKQLIVAELCGDHRIFSGRPVASLVLVNEVQMAASATWSVDSFYYPKVTVALGEITDKRIGSLL
jgi:hypothetical protein